MTKNATGALFAAGMLRGANFLFVGLLVQQIAASEVVAGRLGFAAVAAVGFLMVHGSPSRLRAETIKAASLLATLDTVVPYTLLAFAQTRIDSGLAAVLATTAPLFTMVTAAALARDERLSIVRFGGLILGLLGVIVLTGGGVLAITEGDGTAIGAVMLASITYGGSIVYARKLLLDHDPVTLTAVKLSSGAIQAFLLMVVLEGMPGYGSLTREGWLFLVMLGAAGTGAAYFLHFWAVARVGSVRGSIVTYISPPASMLLGWLILGETLTIPMFLGLALIAGGVATVMFAPSIEWRLKKAWCAVPARSSTSCRVAFPVAA